MRRDEDSIYYSATGMDNKLSRCIGIGMLGKFVSELGRPYIIQHGKDLHKLCEIKSEVI